jgi:hypothetical protein
MITDEFNKTRTIDLRPPDVGRRVLPERVEASFHPPCLALADTGISTTSRVF